MKFTEKAQVCNWIKIGKLEDLSDCVLVYLQIHSGLLLARGFRVKVVALRILLSGLFSCNNMLYFRNSFFCNQTFEYYTCPFQARWRGCFTDETKWGKKVMNDNINYKYVGLACGMTVLKLSLRQGSMTDLRLDSRSQVGRQRPVIQIN